jgi:hypothetical protein
VPCGGASGIFGVVPDLGENIGGASIDSISSNSFQFSIGGGSGQLTLFAFPGGPVLAQTALTGYVTTTNLQETFNPINSSFDIVITATPEPSTFWLVAITVALMLTVSRIWGYRRFACLTLKFPSFQ